MKQSSDIALRSIPLHSTDAAYIDGSHEAKDVIQDAILAWSALKPGGLMVFDDYTWQPPFDTEPLHSPKPAVDAFLNLFAKQISMLHCGIQVALRKLE